MTDKPEDTLEPGADGTDESTDAPDAAEAAESATETAPDATAGAETAPDPADAEPEEAKPSTETKAAPGALPRFSCHKTVEAFKIGGIESLWNGELRLTGVDPAHAVVVGPAYVDKHRPQVGGYYVRYHDGYESWSPSKAFEDGYTRQRPVDAVESEIEYYGQDFRDGGGA